MLRRALAVVVVMALVAAILASCGQESTTPPPTQPETGGLLTFVADVPACDILTLRVTVTELKLKPADGSAEVAVFPQGNAFVSTKVNFASLRDFSTVLNLATVPAGTYNQATVRFSVPQLVLYDPSQTPPISEQIARLSTNTPSAPIQPPLTITKDKVAGLRMHFDLLRSVEVDAQGQVTGAVTPVMTFTPVTPTEAEGFGDFDNIWGFVRAVNLSSSNADFIGSFNLQILSGSGPMLTVNLKPDSVLLGAPALNQLPTGTFAEVSAYIDQNGNVIAREAQIQNRAVVEQNKIAFLGYPIEFTRDADGKVTQFTLYIREEEPDLSLELRVDTTVQVNVSSATTFGISSTGPNFANLTFDATGIVTGVDYVVHGQFTLGEAGEPTIVNADAIYLRLQTTQGNFSPPFVQLGSDDKTGAFWFNACPTLLQGTPVLVFTNNQTAFLNASGLGALSPLPTLLLRGLPFFQRKATTINGVSVPAGTLVFLAKQVHQLP